jgi:hypothetical protein
VALLLAASADAGALGRAAEEVARAVADGPPDRVSLRVAAPGAEGLAEPFAAALAAALGRRGLAAAPLRGREPPEAAARAAGADRLLRVRLALGAGGRDLAVAVEVLPLRESFFLQAYPATPGARLIAFAVPADAAALALARPPATARAAAPSLVPLFALPEPVLALAVAVGGDAPAILAAAPGALLLLSAAGERLASRPAPEAPPGPGRRAPAAALAAAGFGEGRLAWQLAGMPRAEVLDLAGGRLEPVAELAAAPLAGGGAGPLLGAFAPGLPLYQDLLLLRADAAARARSPRLLQGAAAAPRPGRAAFAVLRADDAAEVLGRDLAPAGPPVEGVGAAFALADLDGDGEPELVASRAEPGESDEVRVVRLGPPAEVTFRSEPVAGALLAAAAGDLTGDGVDDVVLAAAVAGGGTRLWLLSSDPREAAR